MHRKMAGASHNLSVYPSACIFVKLVKVVKLVELVKLVKLAKVSQDD